MSSVTPVTNKSHLLKTVFKSCAEYSGQDETHLSLMLNYLLTDDSTLRRPSNTVLFEYNRQVYWRDPWDILYSYRTCRPVGKFYPETKWACFEF